MDDLFNEGDVETTAGDVGGDKDAWGEAIGTRFGKKAKKNH